MRVFVVKTILLPMIIMCTLISYANATKPTLEFSRVPPKKLTTVTGDEIKILLFTVKNNVPGFPNPINSITVTPTSDLITTTISNNCNSLVPPSGTCNIFLKVQVAQMMMTPTQIKATVASTDLISQNLVVNYGGRAINLSTPFQILLIEE